MLNFIPDLEGSAQPVLLFLGAHSDDIEIGCGATILTLSASYSEAEVHWVVFSASGERAAEAKSSARDFLKPFRKSSIKIHEFRNAYFPTQLAEIKDAFEQLKGRVSPDLIFTHETGDRHQDHRTIAELTWNTFRNNLILEYEIPKFDGGLGDPNLFVAVPTDLLQQKLDKLFEHFGSQHDKRWFTRDLFSALMRLRGAEGNSPTGFAEAFYSRKASLGFHSNRQ